MSDFDKNFEKQIKGIATEINELSKDPEKLSDYLSDCLDVEYRCDFRKEYKSVEVCVGFGGPNIYIDTADAKVKGYWGGTTATFPISYEASDAIDDYFEDYFNCI